MKDQLEVQIFYSGAVLPTGSASDRLVFDNAVASYNGDFVIHFTHPTWRGDRNDPSTATRVNEHKVR